MTEFYSDTIGLPKTDPRLWRLRTDELGRENWEYLTPQQAANDPPSTFTQWLLQDPKFPQPHPERNKHSPDFSAFDACHNGASFFKLLQEPDSGIFPCQYKGPMFMTIGYVAVNYIAGIEIPEHERIELIRYIVNTAHPVDGGWGLHSVDKSTVFGTVLNYVILRLLGLPKDHPVCVKARSTLLRLGGAIGSPHWGKIWLSALNLYKWEGVNPAPPETWLLPYSLPMHPGRWWVHTRGVYIPVSYLSLVKFSCPMTPLLEELRNEIYTKPFEKINFSNNRNTVCGVDLYYPHSTTLNIANSFVVFYEKYLRNRFIYSLSKKKVYDLIKTELQNTDSLCIAPVNQAFCALVTLIEEGVDSEAFQRLQYRFKDALFHGPQGMTIMGTNGVQTWDCAFAIQYFFVAGLAERPEFYNTIVSAYKFLCHAQFDTECVPGSYRDKRKGAWGFSTKTQGYTVADCTAEAIKAIIMVKNSPVFSEVHHMISSERLFEGIDVLLNLQNIGSFEYGSFATYEKIKAPLAMETLNPAEVFGNIMVEYPYVECTDSSVLGLTYFHKYFDYRKEEIRTRIRIAIEFIKKSQLPDGSWYGSWGICFTYAGMFALEALHTVGETYENSSTVRKGCDFLVSKQMKDGGWGESMKSSELHSYVDSEKSLVVQTAWALIALLFAEYPNKEVIDRGIDLLKNRQEESGEWKFESVEGVFNHSCAIEYPSYRFLFPIKALGMYSRAYETHTL
ncbi:CEI_1a_G0023840.mRNA.1.CDS.1 [Saccharomyces cerevisiae]|nr:EM14S01-3B_G0054840.mRNA.1.CDS.1 [Saccharomyces cerevisiae]CAI4519909.1 AMH_1a_G0023920.mRNA.1.CDS.1 [Saccharomyces cerevisiae]CAI4526441.1 CEI_1a_G0023840.mRNA.1.CDS.1 [Saccharomyces cerevisiae]CAI6707012.1 AMH_1a_G0023920.mRNA.1.CDS.1 [Saccharomyces cerevisiae]CAI7330369.1 CEI_1a_G0023840.mRNA.1.CDS.1 [Saccharomyces cerevisiae]